LFHKITAGSSQLHSRPPKNAVKSQIGYASAGVHPKRIVPWSKLFRLASPINLDQRLLWSPPCHRNAFGQYPGSICGAAR
jgi:hypothetical protein